MTFLWPPMLFALLALPLLIAFYLIILRKRRAIAAQFARFNFGQARQKPGVRRHLPYVLFFIGLAVLLLSLARPLAEVQIPRVEGTVMLVFDVSASMGAVDVEPSRIEAAKAAARDFVLSQPETVQIGVVSFSDSGFTVQTPTADRNALLATIARLRPTSGTSLGQGIYTALRTIAVDAGLVSEESLGPTPTPGSELRPAPGQQLERMEQSLLEQLPEGIYPPSVIVILSDGEHNMAMDPVAAAQAASDRGVRVDALGFGTTTGIVLELEGFSVFTAMDEGTLQAITQAGGGAYYAANNLPDPASVYANLTPRLVVKPEKMEVTSLFTGASILLFLLGSLFSMAWFQRVL